MMDRQTNLLTEVMIEKETYIRQCQRGDHQGCTTWRLKTVMISVAYT